MSCDSPFEVVVISETVQSPFLFQCNGNFNIPALTIPGVKTCDEWKLTGGVTKCWWSKTTYKTQKKCWLGICVTTKTISKLPWLECYTTPVKNDGCDGWFDSPATPVFKEMSIPVSATIPFMIISGIEVDASTLGVEATPIVQYAIHQNLTINGTNSIFKINMNFGDGIEFPFYLPENEVITITDSGGDFSTTVPLYDFGIFPPYHSPLGFTYTLTMSINLLFCLGSPEWLQVQFITSTEITGNGIPTTTLPISFTIPIE